MDAVSSSAIDFAAGSLFKLIAGVLQVILSGKSAGRDLKEKLMSLKPTFDEILKLSSDESIKRFRSLLDEGLRLAGKLEKTGKLNLYRRYLYGKRILKLERDVKECLITQGMANIMLNVHRMSANIEGSKRLEDLFEMMILQANAGLSSDAALNARLLQHEFQGNCGNSLQVDDGIPDPPSFVVGLERALYDIKKLLFQNHVSCIGIQGMGGSGKTTIASALCTDAQVKGVYGKNIIFITVSVSPNLMNIMETLWKKLLDGMPWPGFQNIKQAHDQLQKFTRLRANQPILVVLDDVWKLSTAELLFFETQGCKTVITTRQDCTIPKKKGVHRYTAPLLERNDALSLFCFWAFCQSSIPAGEDSTLVEEIVQECKGLPLALKVTGSCLQEELPPVWESARKKLSGSEFISEYHKEAILECLEASIDVLDDEVRECFLDLGAFPKGRRFSVDALLDIWVYSRGLEWSDAFAILLQLSSRNLIDLTRIPGNGSITYGCTGELYFSLHDVIRDLAFHLASRDGPAGNKRLFMAQVEKGIPKGWLKDKDRTLRAQFVSIHADSTEDFQWPQITLPDAEILTLFFSATQYCLPNFLSTMPKLKVLLINNNDSKHAKLDGISQLNILTGTSCVTLEKLSVRDLSQQFRLWKNLKKLSICLCEGLGGSTPFQENQTLLFPNLVELDFSYCRDMEELREEFLSSSSLQRLSITDCHDTLTLPDCLERLSSLKVMKLSACLSLQKLPPSTCMLKHLEFLDLSFCRSLSDLPEGIAQLKKLKVIDIRGCRRLRKMFNSLALLESLQRVICDEEDAHYWLSIKETAMPNLIVEVSEEQFSVEWLND